MVIDTDVLVVGAGTAGLRAAIAAADGGVRVLLVTKKPLDYSGVTNADVAEMAGFNAGKNDAEIELHYQDIVDAGQHVVNESLARIVAENAPLALSEMLEWGVPYEKTDNNELFQFKSCFSSYPRTHVVPGHGRNIAEVLRREVLQRKSIKILTAATIIGLLTGDGSCVGAWGMLGDELITINAKATILATGGGGLAFARSFSPTDVTGAAYEMAWQAGAVIQNIEFMQIGIGISHPLVNIFNGYLWQGIPILQDGNGDEIFSSVLPEGLSHLDVFESHLWHYPFSTRDDSKYLEIAINRAITAGRGAENGGIELDLRHMSDEYVASLDQSSGISHMWPLARNYLRSRGVDLLSETVEIACYQHAMNGGVKIDENGESTIPGLYAVGECAGGPHGADRLGGNMFVTSLIFGKIAGAHAAHQSLQKKTLPTWDSESVTNRAEKEALLRSQVDTQGMLRKLQEMAQNSLLIDRTEEGLDEVITFTESIQKTLRDAPLSDVMESTTYDLSSIARTAWLIANSAKQRKESRGSHHRADYPELDSAFNAIIEQRK